MSGTQKGRGIRACRESTLTPYEQSIPAAVEVEVELWCNTSPPPFTEVEFSYALRGTTLASVELKAPLAYKFCCWLLLPFGDLRRNRPGMIEADDDGGRGGRVVTVV